MLREIRDLTSHGIPMKLPHGVTQKIENIDILKLQAVNTRLSAATSQFNIMEQSLMDIERSLVYHNIDKARKVDLIFKIQVISSPLKMVSDRNV